MPKPTKSGELAAKILAGARAEIERLRKFARPNPRHQYQLSCAWEDAQRGVVRVDFAALTRDPDAASAAGRKRCQRAVELLAADGLIERLSSGGERCTHFRVLDIAPIPQPAPGVST